MNRKSSANTNNSSSTSSTALTDKNSNSNSSTAASTAVSAADRRRRRSGSSSCTTSSSLSSTSTSAGSSNNSVVGGGGRLPEMSPYDRQRDHHKLVTAEKETTTISPRSMDSELMCPICLDMLRVTMTTKECLHRFCYECISTALRNGNKECPTCRKKLVSKRSLRPDPKFDALISKIYPNRAEYDAMQEKKLNSLGVFPDSQNSKKRGKRTTKTSTTINEIVADEKVPRTTDPDTVSSLSIDTTAATNTTTDLHQPVNHTEEVELILRPHPDILTDYQRLISEGLLSGNGGGGGGGHSSSLNQLRQTRYLKTTGSATVDHIGQYVYMRARLDLDEAAGTTIMSSPPQNGSSRLSPSSTEQQQEKQQHLSPSSFRIFVNPGIGSNRAYTLLEGSWSLSEVRNRFWKVKRPLELQFRVQSSTSSNMPPNGTVNGEQAGVSSSSTSSNGESNQTVSSKALS